jgi:hypothetical protein
LLEYKKEYHKLMEDWIDEGLNWNDFSNALSKDKLNNSEDILFSDNKNLEKKLAK